MKSNNVKLNVVALNQVYLNVVTLGGFDMRRKVGSSNKPSVPDEPNKIYYTATAKVEPKDGTLGTSVVSNEWDPATNEGIITCEGDITTIGNSAFLDKTSLTSILIPNTVTTIDQYAFSGCTSLIKTTIPESVTAIGRYAFRRCTGELVINSKIIETDYSWGNHPTSPNSGVPSWLYQAAFTKLIIGDNITKLGTLVFYDCSFVSVEIPNSVTSIGESAFSDCENLTKITIPNSVTSIGNRMCQNCPLLTNVTIPDTITEIGSESFSNTGLTSIIIPNSVTSIGNYAFFQCTSLIKTTIPNNVTSIGYSAFGKCTGELFIDCNTADVGSYYDAPFKDSLFTKITIGNNVTSIGKNTFYGCNGLTGIIIPESVTYIGTDAFKYIFFEKQKFINKSTLDAESNSYWGAIIADVIQADGLCILDDSVSDCRPDATLVTIPNTVTSIGDKAFLGCSKLTNITIPSNIISIGQEAFSGCGQLTSMTIPGTVTSIGSKAFYNCAKLADIIIENGVTSIGYSAFYGCRNLTNVTLPDGMVDTVGNPFYGCYSIVAFYGNNVSADNRCWIINGVLKSFAGSGLEEYEIPTNVTSIGQEVFMQNSRLKSIIIPNSVISIEQKAFKSCCGLTSIVIPDSVTTIGSSAFYYSSNLAHVTLGSGITTIGNSAFYTSGSLLKEVYCRSTNPPQASHNIFNTSTPDRKIYVPTESVGAYKSATNWSAYADYIVGYDFE